MIIVIHPENEYENIYMHAWVPLATALVFISNRVTQNNYRFPTNLVLKEILSFPSLSALDRMHLHCTYRILRF